LRSNAISCKSFEITFRIRRIRNSVNTKDIFMQKDEITKPVLHVRPEGAMQTVTRQALSKTVGWLKDQRYTLLALALLASGGTAQAEELGKFKWSPVVDENERLVIRGIQYAPEFAPEPWSISRASDSTTDVTRFEVRAGDQWGEDRSSGENKERSELDGYKRRFPQGADVWGAYAFLIEPGQEYHSDWTAINQMHGSKVRSFHVHYKEGRMIIYTEAAGANGQAASGMRYAGLISRNVWHQMVFHFKGGSSTDGRLEFWLDAKKILDYTGAIGAPGNQAYWKFGIYRGYGPIQTPFAIQFANMEVGSSNLSARIANPLPIK
jgi:hypothetical protein